MDKNADYRKGLDKTVNKKIDTAHLGRGMTIPAQDTESEKTKWVKEHEV